MKELQCSSLPYRGIAFGLLILTAGAASARQAGLYVAPPDEAGESARRAAEAAAPHVAERFGVAPLAELGPAAVEAPELLAALDAWNAAGRRPLRNGFARPLAAPRRVELALAPAAAMLHSSAPQAGPGLPAPAPVVALDGGVLAQTGFSTVAWGGKVRVAGAFRLRLHLARVTLPAGARLWVHGGGRTAGPFGGGLVASDGGLWTPSVGGEEVSLDVEAPAAALAGATGYGFVVDEVLELVANDGAGSGLGASPKSGCQVDASCFGSGDFPGFDAARHAVARLEFIDGHASFLCTGQLLNDSASDGTPFLLTAHHCISTQDVATTLQADFDDFTPSCNGTPPALTTLPTANGATLLVTGRADTAPDFTLLRLGSVPAGRTFLGWDAAPHAVPDGTLLFRLSHPSGDAQMYSVTRADSRSAQCTQDNLPLSRFIYSDLVVGAASPGSSGGAAMLADGRVVGQLFGGCGNGDFCSAGEHVVDGALASSFAQLQPFLSPGASGPCVPGAFTQCLVQRRFQVQVTWANQFNGTAGVANAIRGSDETGYFYFTDPANFELIVKILQFGAEFKVFYAELTNLHFTITVADTHTGAIKTYTNTPGDCGAIDGAAFPAATPTALAASAALAMPLPGIAGPAAATAAGTAGAAVDAARSQPEGLAGLAEPRRSCGAPLCLLGGRFAVSVQWMNQFNGTSGAGRGKSLSDISGLFTFTDPSDVELVLKVVQFPGHTGFFYAALSNLEYDITVADSASGTVRTYHNPAGTYCGGIDSTAFPP